MCISGETGEVPRRLASLRLLARRGTAPPHTRGGGCAAPHSCCCSTRQVVARMMKAVTSSVSLGLLPLLPQLSISCLQFNAARPRAPNSRPCAAPPAASPASAPPHQPVQQLPAACSWPCGASSAPWRTRRRSTCGQGSTREHDWAANVHPVGESFHCRCTSPGNLAPCAPLEHQGSLADASKRCAGRVAAARQAQAQGQRVQLLAQGHQQPQRLAGCARLLDRICARQQRRRRHLQLLPQQGLRIQLLDPHTAARPCD